jgi:predicted nucleic acid-binding protein
VIAYLDTSALLRLLLREPAALKLEEVKACEALVSSEILAVESHRTIDRLRVLGKLTMDEAAAVSDAIRDWLESVDLVLLRPPILARASEPFPTAIGALDAIHLATALVWRDRKGQEITMATHDSGLAAAARAFGFDVLGGSSRPRGPFE